MKRFLPPLKRTDIQLKEKMYYTYPKSDFLQKIKVFYTCSNLRKPPPLVNYSQKSSVLR